MVAINNNNKNLLLNLYLFFFIQMELSPNCFLNLRRSERSKVRNWNSLAKNKASDLKKINIMAESPLPVLLIMKVEERTPRFVFVCILPANNLNAFIIFIFLHLQLGGLDDDFDFRGRKKRNLNHLLNFHCKPRDNVERFSYRSPQVGLFPNTIRNLMVTQKHKYNKEQFLQAK